MSGFTFVCPRSRPDENGAHDIWGEHDEPAGLTVLYCHRCGQTITVAEALEASRQDPDAEARR